MAQMRSFTVPVLALLAAHEELVAEALARQEERVAYVDEKLSAEVVGGTG